MNAYVALYTAVLLPFISFAGDQPGKRLYGEQLKEVPLVEMHEILAHPSDYNKREVTLEATVAEVCQNKGCWMFVTDGKNRIRVDFKNYGFFVPYDSEGKKVRIQGKVYEKMVDKNVAKHWAEESKNPDVRAEEITEDVKMVMITASGVLMDGGSEFSQEQLDVIGGKTTKEH